MCREISTLPCVHVFNFHILYILRNVGYWPYTISTNGGCCFRRLLLIMEPSCWFSRTKTGNYDQNSKVNQFNIYIFLFTFCLYVVNTGMVDLVLLPVSNRVDFTRSHWLSTCWRGRTHHGTRFPRYRERVSERSTWYRVQNDWSFSLYAFWF